MKVRYTHQALLDLDEIYATIAKENAAAANRVVTEIEHEIEHLKCLSSSGPSG